MGLRRGRDDRLAGVGTTLAATTLAATTLAIVIPRWMDERIGQAIADVAESDASVAQVNTPIILGHFVFLSKFVLR